MKEFLLFTLLLMPVTTHPTSEDVWTCVGENGGFEHKSTFQIKGGEPPLAVKGHKERNISIQCKYPAKFKESIKHFCGRQKIPYNIEKYHLYDNKSENTFTVTIHNLNKHDSGTYWCGVKTGGNNVTFNRQVDLQIPVYVEVKAFARGGIVIHCKMHDHQYKRRYFCKGNRTDCLTHTTDSRFKPWEGVLWDYLSFVSDNLTSDYNGTYYCAADRKLHTEYQLHVGNGNYFEQLQITENEGKNVVIQCKYPRELLNSSKIFCKEQEGCKPLNSTKKYSLFDVKNENVFNVTIYNVEKKDAGIYCCGVKPGKNYAILISKVVFNISDKPHAETDIKTPVLVVTVVLLLAVIIFLCLKDRQSRKHGRSNNVIYYTTENPDPERIYEEIEDIGLPPCPGSSSTCTVATVDNTHTANYCTVQSPLNLPDETRQHLLSKGTHSPVTTTVYTTAQLPTVTTPFPTIPGDVPTYLNIQSLTHTSTDGCLMIDADETESSVNSVYANAQEPIDGPTSYTGQSEEPTNSVNQEGTEYAMVSCSTNTQINVVYVTAEFTANIRSNNSTNQSNQAPSNLSTDTNICAEQMPLNPINDPTQLLAQEQPE